MKRIALACLMALTSLTHATGEKWYGLTLNIDADGFFHPIVRSIRVERIAPDSPAERAGLLSGDRVLELQGVKVAGARADALEKLQKPVGDTLRLKIQHGTAEPREVILMAAQKP
jgi:C-terminal processing protease CtpA/Prc